MVAIDIGDQRYHRLQQQKRAIGFVGLGDQVAAFAQPRIGAEGVDQPADHERRIHPGAGQQAGHQRGGGGLSVGSSHGDTGTKAHQLTEHFGSRHYRYSRLSRGVQLDVVGCWTVALSWRSDPLTSNPRLTSTSAMPLMPAPPIPTK